MNNLSRPTAPNSFQIRRNIYILRNFQQLPNTKKNTVKMGLEKISYRGPQL